jgi:hypothetical protein
MKRLEMGAINGWAVLHVVVTIIEQRPTTDWGEGFLLGITYCNAKIEKTGKGGSGHDCQLGWGNDLVK